MAKVDLQEFGASRPKVVPEDLKGDTAVFTITDVEQVEVSDEGDESKARKCMVLVFEELPGKALWLNRGQIETLVIRLGDEDSTWVGERVPVERHVAEYKGQRFPKVRVCPVDQWDELLRKGTAPGARRQAPARSKGQAARR